MHIEFALVPFSARAVASDNQDVMSQVNTIDIVSHHPPKPQWAEVCRVKGTKDISLKPKVSVSALGNGGSFSGLGLKKHFNINKVSTISLKPEPVVLVGSPTRLRW
jgi:hypothetical protein